MADLETVHATLDHSAVTGTATRSSLGLATSDSPQFAGVNVGHASDTTITRTGAGDVAVEGNALYRAGGTDVPVADGGTGASSASAARTNLGLIIGTDVQGFDADIATVSASQAEMEAGTETALRSVSPLRVAQAIAALGGGGGGGGISPAYLGYNTVGGSTQAMTQQRIYAKQITAGGSGNVLLSVEARVAVTVEAVTTWGFFLFEDSGSDTIGDLIELETSTKSTNGFSAALIHATGNYPARWLGKSFGRLLAASTKYWVGVSWLDGTGNPNLYYDGSGSDRRYDAGTGPYAGDGAYFSQTDTTNKHSIRALVL